MKHTFHESCLARSILSQLYVCPFPGCEHALLPGLLHLQLKRKACKGEQPCEQKQELSSMTPVLEPSLAVLGIPQQHLDTQTPGNTHSKAHQAYRGTSRSRRHANDPPSLPSLIPVGITPHQRHNSDLPPVSRRGASKSRNQLEHERIPSRDSCRLSPAQGATRTKTTKPSRGRSALPLLDQREILPPLQGDERVTENRLHHAEKIRAELKAVERERLQRQRALREERRRRHKESNSSPAFAGAFIGTDSAECTQIPRPQVTRLQQSRAVKLKVRERQQHLREASQLPSTLPDLFVGNRR